MNLFLWGVLPYISFTLLIGGLIWRYRTDQYGWTSRSSQLNEGASCASRRPYSTSVFWVLLPATSWVWSFLSPGPRQWV